MSELQQSIIDHVLIHATCVAINGKGILLLGKSGSGKSDLALRLCDQNGHGIASVAKMASLVADDQVILRLMESKVMASAPASIAGKLEIRGLGIVLMPYLSEVQIKLIACLSNLINIERLPAPEATPVSSCWASNFQR